MAAASSSKTAADETQQEDHIWIELKLLESLVMQSRLGQSILRLADKFLWTVEKCAEWSLPRQDVSEDGKDSGKPKLVRPLPWLLFLPSLVMLRTIRVTGNIGVYILGYPAITPSEMVKLVQKSRRYLNATMKKGMKERCEVKDKRPSMNEAKKALIRSIRLTLSSLSCLDASKPSLSPPPTKIYVSSVLDPDPVTTTSEEKSVTESMDSTEKLKDSSSESEEEEKEETLDEKIDRLALDSSEGDEDFDPTGANSDEDDDDEDDDDDENSDDGNVSPSEIREIIEDTYVPLSANKNLKQQTECFLNSEKICALDSKQESDQPVCEKRSSAKESRDKAEERLATSKRRDSPECYTPDRSSQEGDPTFYSPISSDSDAPKESSVPIAEQSKSSARRANNGAVVEKRSTNVSKCHKGKRTSHGSRKKK
ncbi:PREDICTED: acidic repeat-containing protein isoform X2 [Wasmannia auropunctata]|uniref:acidic repeat-containing protein isoform X2 n=1 Tax=Wasmannia auropunctata TaxID=64793 RepID=UPI0005EFAAEA|nr:PREDICTED: acidic repeat-containing protein isoform X2 [Wasmannia auropunctata]